MFNMLNAVCVVVERGNTIDAIYAWEDNQWGNQRAEDKMKIMMTAETPMSDEEIESALEDGVWENADGSYKISLAHSIT